MTGSIPALMAVAAAVSSAPTVLTHEISAEFPVDVEDARPHLARVDERGFVYIGEASTGRVLAYTWTGNRLWETQIAPDQRNFNLRALDVGCGGRVVALESWAMVVHVLSASNGLPVDSVAVNTSASPPGGLVCGEDGGFFVVAGERGGVARDGSLHHFDARGRADRSFGHRPLVPIEPRGRGRDRSVALDGSLARGVDGVLYHRPAGSIAFHRFAPDGRQLETTVPDVPFTPRGAVVPGDLALVARALSGQRLMFEVVHRTPYREAEDGVPTTRIRRVLYVVEADGSVAAMLNLDRAGLGSFVDLSRTDGRAFFLKARPLLLPGEEPAVQVVTIRGVPLP